jgi:hypothetical protein
MKRKTLNVAPKAFDQPFDGAVRIGRLVAITPAGEPVVDYPGNTGEPLVARIAVPASAHDDIRRDGAQAVLLVFEGGDVQRPVIIGLVQDCLAPPAKGKTAVLQRTGHEPVTIDGKTVDLKGRESIALQCGKASITLHMDGRVIIKGTRLVSRASEANKIKGATIALN